MYKNLKKILDNRFSCRFFKKWFKIPEEDIDKIVSWAYLGPSSCELWPFSLILVKNNKIINLIANLRHEHKIIKNASLLIFVTQENLIYKEGIKKDYITADEWHIDASIAWIYIDLIATSLSYNTLWMWYYESRVWRKILDIPKSHKLLYYIAIWKKWHENLKKENHNTYFKDKIYNLRFWKKYYGK